jgi:hypothetical protein
VQDVVKLVKKRIGRLINAIVSKRNKIAAGQKRHGRSRRKARVYIGEIWGGEGGVILRDKNNDEQFDKRKKKGN